jgi:hypothetical protein
MKSRFLHSIPLLALMLGCFLLLPSRVVADSEDDIREDEERQEQRREDIRHDEQQREIRREDATHHEQQLENIQSDYNERRIRQEEIEKQQKRLNPGL